MPAGQSPGCWPQSSECGETVRAGPLSQSWGPGLGCLPHPLRGPPEARKRDRGIPGATRKASRRHRLAGPVGPPAVHQGRVVTLSSPRCYLKVPPASMAVELSHQEPKGREPWDASCVGPWGNLCPSWALAPPPVNGVAWL